MGYDRIQRTDRETCNEKCLIYIRRIQAEIGGRTQLGKHQGHLMLHVRRWLPEVWGATHNKDDQPLGPFVGCTGDEMRTSCSIGDLRTQVNPTSVKAA